ncbi:MAG: hypothetical protein AAGH89_08850 [Verrucomicrobiota bacterium]
MGAINPTFLPKENHEHTQAAAADEWVITHGLGKRPGGIYIEDSFGAEIKAAVVHDNENQLTIHFSSITSGKAYLS